MLKDHLETTFSDVTGNLIPSVKKSSVIVNILSIFRLLVFRVTDHESKTNF